MTISTLSDALQASAELDAGVTYLDGQREPHRVTYATLRARALRVLAELQARDVTPGTAVVFQLDGNQQLVEAFWACQLGGYIPVPLNVGGIDEHQRKTLNVLEQLEQPQLLTQGRHPERLWELARREGTYERFAPVFASAIDIEQIAGEGTHGVPHAARGSDVASVQYSSGSTGQPKGVLLTHANLLADIQAIIERAAMSRDDRHLSWVPLTHDLGMVMFHLLPVVLGVEQCLMAANQFARRPLAWLQQASAHRATVLCSPNFGYSHYLKAFAKHRESAELDLSSVRLIFNGGEPIARDVCDAFTAALAPWGLSATAIRPAYGLAEACVAVTMTQPGRPVRSVAVDRATLRVGRAVTSLEDGAAGATQVACVGEPLAVCEVAVVDDERTPLPADHYGHVLVRGPIVSPGYYGDSAQNDDAWLDTGDLGFLHGGELYVLGRAKDAVIVNGVNYHPSDLERVCHDGAGLETGKVTCCGAPGVNGGVERLLVFVVHRQDLDAFRPIVKAVRRAIGEHAQLEVAHVLPVRSMPKTTSGKIQRYALVNEFLAGAFEEAVAALQPLPTAAGDDGTYTDLERRLHGIFNAVVPDQHIGRTDDIVEAGVSSLALADVAEAIDEEFPDLIELEDFLDHPTIAELALCLEARGAGQA